VVEEDISNNEKFMQITKKKGESEMEIYEVRRWRGSEMGGQRWK